MLSLFFCAALSNYATAWNRRVCRAELSIHKINRTNRRSEDAQCDEDFSGELAKAMEMNKSKPEQFISRFSSVFFDDSWSSDMPSAVFGSIKRFVRGPQMWPKLKTKLHPVAF